MREGDSNKAATAVPTWGHPPKSVVLFSCDWNSARRAQSRVPHSLTVPSKEEVARYSPDAGENLEDSDKSHAPQGTDTCTHWRIAS